MSRHALVFAVLSSLVTLSSAHAYCGGGARLNGNQALFVDVTIDRHQDIVTLRGTAVIPDKFKRSVEYVLKQSPASDEVVVVSSDVSQAGETGRMTLASAGLQLALNSQKSPIGETSWLYVFDVQCDSTTSE